MRSIERIDTFLNKLKEEWKKVPDQRFTQFLYNHGITNIEHLYHLEEDELLQWMFPEE